MQHWWFLIVPHHTYSYLSLFSYYLFSLFFINNNLSQEPPSALSTKLITVIVLSMQKHACATYFKTGADQKCPTRKCHFHKTRHFQKNTHTKNALLAFSSDTKPHYLMNTPHPWLRVSTPGWTGKSTSQNSLQGHHSPPPPPGDREEGHPEAGKGAEMFYRATSTW